MAGIRDLLVGAIVSGAVTFGTTYYFGEREHQRSIDESNRALEQAQAQVAAQARQARTAELYERWTGPEFAQYRAVLDQALRRRAQESILTWDVNAAPGESGAMREVLRFYGELGIEMRAERLDDNLVRGLFGPNVEWWNVRALPSLCRGYTADGTDDRFNNALLTFEEISGRAAQNCPSFATGATLQPPGMPVTVPRPMPAPMPAPMPSPMPSPPD